MSRLVVGVEVALQDRVDAGAVGAVEHQVFVGWIPGAQELVFGRLKLCLQFPVVDVVDPLDGATDEVAGGQGQLRQQPRSLVVFSEL